MKKIFLFSLMIPCLFFGLDIHLSSLQNTLKTQSQTNLNLIRMLFDGYQEDEEASLSSAFIYVQESKYKAKKGSFSLLSRLEDDSILIPHITYDYTNLKDVRDQLSSHSISVGLKSMIDTDFLSIFSGISIGGNFNSISSNHQDYSYLFVNGQLGIGEEIDFYNSRIKISPILYMDYSYLYQKATQNISPKDQHIHSLDLLTGTQLLVGLLKSENSLLSLVAYAYYKHIFMGQKLKAQDQSTRTRNKDSGYIGGGLNWKINAFSLNLDVGSEFAKNTYSLQGLIKIGVDF